MKGVPETVVCTTTHILGMWSIGICSEKWTLVLKEYSQNTTLNPKKTLLHTSLTVVQFGNDHQTPQQTLLHCDTCTSGNTTHIFVVTKAYITTTTSNNTNNQDNVYSAVIGEFIMFI